MHNCEIRVYKKDEVILRQGDQSPFLYFMLRGSAGLTVTKQDMGSIPVIIKVVYDGQDFGEQTHLKESDQLSREVVEQLNMQKCTAFANEEAWVMSFNKDRTFGIMEKGV